MAPTPVAARRRRDAQLASLAIEHGTGICSFESDFALFDGLRWIHPDRR
jgi:predicted nucleic acid-binding protein